MAHSASRGWNGRNRELKELEYEIEKIEKVVSR
jgi:hypothetical protein